MRRTVVDENDNILGYKSHDEFDPAGDIYRVSVVWLQNSKAEVLIAQRGLLLRREPGLWGPSAAGKVEEGESYEDNAHKEVMEEIGVSGTRLRLISKFFVDAPVSGAPNRFFCQYYVGTLDQPESSFVLDEREVASVKWTSTTELKADFEAHPENYLTGMPQAMRFLPTTT